MNPSQIRDRRESGIDYRHYSKPDLGSLTSNYNDDGSRDTFIADLRAEEKTLLQLFKEPEFLMTVACFGMSIFVFFLYFYRFLKNARDKNRIFKEEEKKKEKARAFWRDMNQKAEERDRRKGRPNTAARSDEEADGGNSESLTDGDLPPTTSLPDDRMTMLKRETRHMAAIVDRYKERSASLEEAIEEAHKKLGAKALQLRRPNGRPIEPGPLPPMAGAVTRTASDFSDSGAAERTPSKSLRTSSSQADALNEEDSLLGSSTPLPNGAAKGAPTSLSSSPLTEADTTKHVQFGTSSPSNTSPNRWAYIVNGRTTRALTSDVFGYQSMSADEQKEHENKFRCVEKKVLAARQSKAKSDSRKLEPPPQTADNKTNNNVTETEKRERLITEAKARDEAESQFLSTFLSEEEHAFWEDNMKRIKQFHRLLRKQAAMQWERRRGLVAEMVALEELQKQENNEEANNEEIYDVADASTRDARLASVTKKLDLKTYARDEKPPTSSNDANDKIDPNVRRILAEFESDGMKPTDAIRS